MGRKRLSGESIPLSGRIVAPADVIDALTTPAPTSRVVDAFRALDPLALVAPV